MRRSSTSTTACGPACPGFEETGGPAGRVWLRVQTLQLFALVGLDARRLSGVLPGRSLECCFNTVLRWRCSLPSGQRLGQWRGNHCAVFHLRAPAWLALWAPTPWGYYARRLAVV